MGNVLFLKGDPKMIQLVMTLCELHRFSFRSVSAGKEKEETLYCSLTAIIAERCKLDSLLSVASAVVDLHLQLIPGGLLQIIQDVAFGEGGALCRDPCGVVYGPILQGERGDGAASIIPAIQV